MVEKEQHSEYESQFREVLSEMSLPQPEGAHVRKVDASPQEPPITWWRFRAAMWDWFGR